MIQNMILPFTKRKKLRFSLLRHQNLLMFFWRLRDPQGKPPGAMGWWPSRAVTFIDNHDTGSTQAHWPFPSNHIMEGYAYILTHPGIPTVFYDHFYDWGDSIHEQIVKLMNIRRRQDIHSRSSVRILESQNNLYSAMIGDKVCMNIGDGSWCPSGREWTKICSVAKAMIPHPSFLSLLIPLVPGMWCKASHSGMMATPYILKY
ncbi:hypothetical protein HRI_001977300 [Hibiscus trionum]|uniref:alpha-amylase n=1 Tax=Hibiscus trionum TaxID=183268 RepID=A0A9W7HW78_HIBTR|nr:hypothetical protein HRI_001977300 [Hibiscus trionum]